MRWVYVGLLMALSGCGQGIGGGIEPAPTVVSSRHATAEDVEIETRIVETQGIRDCHIRNGSSDLALALLGKRNEAPRWIFYIRESVYPGTEMFVRSDAGLLRGNEKKFPSISASALSALGNAPVFTYSYTGWPYRNLIEKTTTFRGITGAIADCSAFVSG